MRNEQFGVSGEENVGTLGHIKDLSIGFDSPVTGGKLLSHTNVVQYHILCSAVLQRRPNFSHLYFFSP